jgi:WD40 repeat protein
MNDISVDIDVGKNDDDKIFTFDDKPHNGKPITNIEVSPKGKYLVTYSHYDHSFVGWNVEVLDKEQIKLDNTIQEVRIDNIYVKSLCVSDDKKLVYTYDYNQYDGK